MNILRIVIIGAAEYIPLDKTKNSQPSSLPKEVEEATTLCENNNYKLFVYIIDEHLYRATKGDKDILKYYPKNVGYYPEKYQDVFHSRCARVVNKEVAEKFDSFRDSPEKIIYINIISENDSFENVLKRDKSPHDLAFMVHTETFTNKYFLCFTPGEFSLENVVQHLFADNIKELYNPVSGDTFIHSDYEDNSKNNPALYRIIKTGLEHLIWYLKADYSDYKNDLQVPCWVLQTSSCWNQAIIDYYLIAPGMPEFQGGNKNIGFADQDIQIYMNDYSGFRKSVADCTLAVLSNFVINNKIVTIEKVKEMKGWKSLDLWIHINTIY